MNGKIWCGIWLGIALSLEVPAQKPEPAVQAKDGQLWYIADARGNRVLDFSYCGYRLSNEDIPNVKNVLYVPWQEGDCSALIQKAIDWVSVQKPGTDGFRGAVLLGKGTYVLQTPLRISASGVVLRGSGIGETGTVLQKRGADRGALLYVEGSGNPMVKDTFAMADPYVPVNSREIAYAGNAKFQAGDRVLIVRPSVKGWIEELGCDQFGGGISALGWKPGDIDITWDRTVVSAAGGRIVLDAPLTVALDAEQGGGLLMPYRWEGRISCAGIENMTLVSDYDTAYPKDEDHCWTGISIDKAEDCWVRRVNFKHLAGSAVLIQPQAARITVEDCISQAPVSEIGGLRRMTFLTLGQLALFQRCHSEQGIHDFAAGFCAPGPNAFVQCETWESRGFSGAVDSWACGLLFDIVNIDGHNLSLKNLGQDKNGAGWSSGNSMCWQCTAAEIECWSPAPDAINRAYGSWAQFSGDGEWYSSNNHIQPRSLFYAQLEQRTGKKQEHRARILPRNTSASSSPTVEQAMKMAKEAYIPRLTLLQWIAEGEFTASVDSTGVRSVQDIPTPKKSLTPSQRRIQVVNGKIVADGSLIVGGKHEVPWWSGKTRTSYLAKAKPHITRFVPGREGQGLTDRIDSVVYWMKQNHMAVLDHNYGLWYERRRDDHERIRRRDGDVWAPFYEQPFARSGVSSAWEGLSKYDLNRPNAWYWGRLKEFADKGAQEGLLLFHENYFQHNILEAGAHWVDCPWRATNNINGTGFPEPVPFAGDKRIFVADMFYDISHPVRRELHRNYIRQCLNNFADNNNVVQVISAEFTGPLHFVQFWLDVIAEWEAETGKQATVALSATKDVQDAILQDTRRADIVDIIDIRYWHYKNDGTLYAPEGGKNMAPRQHARKMKVGKVTFPEAYRAVSEYRKQYPDKAVTYYAQNYPAMAWAVFMAGGSCPSLPVGDREFLKTAATMQPVELGGDKMVKMVKSDTGMIIFSQSSDEIPLTLESGNYCLKTINPATGEVEVKAKKLKGGRIYPLQNPSGKTRIFWFQKL